MAADPVIPPPLDDDDDDVAWALQTAAVQWNRGARADAVVWLRRAVDAAIACGNAQRTKDLTRLAAAVADSLVSEAMAQPDSAAPPPGSDPPSESHDFDRLLPNPRNAQRSLTGEIPFEVESEGASDAESDAPSKADGDDEDDFDDEAPTIPPPADLSLVRPPVTTHASGEYSVNADDLLPESLAPVPVPPSVPESPESLEPLSHEPTMVSEEDAALPPSETPTLERDVHSFEPENAVSPVVAEDQAPTLDSPVEPSLGAEAEAPPSVEPTLVVPVASDQKPEEPSVDEPAVVDGVSLEQVRGFEDLPEDAQRKLAASAIVAELSPDEEVLSFAAALVTAGRVGIMPAIADVAAGLAQSGDVVFTRGTLDEGVLLRVVALQPGTRVATWSSEALATALSDCPWVADELRLVADRFQALAGSVLGPLGDRLDDSLRALVTPKLEVRAYGPSEIIVEQGKIVPGLHVVGAGRIEIIENDAVADELGPGDFLFAAEVLSAGKAHATARAGRGGALLLVASRTVAHELLTSVPPLLEILAD